MKFMVRIIAVVLFLIVVAVLAIPILVDPNELKEEIAEAVEARTGRTVDIKGDLAFSVFPWLGVDIGATSMTNAEGFSDRPYAAVDAVQVRIKLLPLLRKRLEMDTIVLKGLQLSLETNANGISNAVQWSNGDPDERVESAETDSAEKEFTLAGLAIGGVQIVDANILWEDQSAPVRYQVDGLNLEMGALAPGETVPFRISMQLDSSEPSIQGPLEFSAMLKFSDDADKIELSNVELLTDLQGETIPNGRIRSTLTFSAMLDRTRQRAELSDLLLEVDDSKLTGTLAVNNFSEPEISFSLVLDQIDVDQYIPEQTEADIMPDPAAAASAATQLIPVETLRGLNVDGRLMIGALKISQLRSSAIDITLKAKNGRVSMDPIAAKLYDGTYKGSVQLNVRDTQPKISLQETLSGVQVGPLLNDYLGKESLLGTANVKATLTMAGQTIDDFKKTTNGDVSFDFTDGAIKGFNLVTAIRQAKDALKGKPVENSIAPQQTDFAILSGTAKIANGVVNNQDLIAKSPLFRITGKGTVDLVHEQIDYLLTAKIVGSLEGQDGKALKDLQGVKIPVQIGGTFTKPSYKIKTDKVLKDAAKTKVKETLEKEIEKKYGDKLRKLFN